MYSVDIFKILQRILQVCGSKIREPILPSRELTFVKHLRKPGSMSNEFLYFLSQIEIPTDLQGKLEYVAFYLKEFTRKPFLMG